MKKTKPKQAIPLPDCRNLLRIMKLVFVCLLLGTNIMWGALTYAQRTSLELNLDNVELEDVFDAIRRQSEFEFFYNNDQVNTSVKVSVRLKNADINEVLEQVLPDNYEYKINDRYILINKKKKENTIVASPIPQQTKKTIQGKVVDTSGEPIIGGNIVEKGTTNGVITDIDGRFTFSVNEGAILQVSYIGYVTREVSVRNQSNITITLSEDMQALDEVVIVGYGTQKKEVVTGAITTMKSEDISLSPSGNMASGLAGRLSGVIINTRNGEPGADGSTIRIRGQNSTVANDPLYVVDGIVREEEGGILSRFDPEDIESITVLKDASAAIYGSRAANGVILITTKRGKVGKPTFSVSYNHAFSQPTRVVKMANSASYATAQNLANEMRGIAPRWTEDEIQKFANGSDPLNYPNTNWYKAVQKDWSGQDKVNMQLSGGTENLAYLVSGGFLDQGSPYNNSSMKNRMYNIRSNIDAKINEYIKFTVDLFGKNTDRGLPYNGAASGGGMYSWVGLSAPTVHAVWPGTDYPTNRGWGNLNTLALSSGEAGHTKTTNWVFNGQSTIDISIPWVKGLSLKGSIAYDYSGQRHKQFEDVYYVYDYDQSSNTYEKIMGHTTAPQLTIEEKRTEYINGNVRINYLNTFADLHTVDAFVGFEQNESKFTSLNGKRTNFPTGVLEELNAGDANTQTNESKSHKTARQNYFGRLLYDYDHKYMLQFQFRYDGSHNFPSGNRFGFFPGISGGWTMTRENFMQNINWLSNLKIRGSWGKMGNDYLEQSFQYLTMYTLADGSVFNGTQYQGISQANAPNPYITWEKAETFDIGLETGFLNNRLTFEFDLFKTKRSDILTTRNASVPGFTGLTLPAENIGETENKGLEMMLGFRDNPTKDFSYSVSGNLTYARNKIIYIDETPMAEAYQKREGKPIGAELKYKAIGIYTDADIADPNVPKRAGTVAGDIKIWDANGDGEINSLDQIRQDLTNVPEIVYGLNISLSYKQFDLILGFQGQARAVFYLRQDWVNPATSNGGGNILQWWTEDTYTSDNPNGSKPRLGTAYGIGNTTFTQISAAFFKLKNAELGYNVPKDVSSKVGLQRARVYVSGSNLFSIDKTRKFGIDPEAANGGWDLNPMRLINLGINVSF